jgi:ribosomal protein S27E
MEEDNMKKKEWKPPLMKKLDIECPNCNQQTCILMKDGVFCTKCIKLILRLSKKQISAIVAIEDVVQAKKQAEERHQAALGRYLKNAAAQLSKLKRNEP